MTKNYFYNLLLSLVNILFPILSFPYVARILGPDGLGKVQFVISFAMYFGLFAALGIPSYGIKRAAEYKNDPEKLSATFIELTVICLITSLFFFMLYVMVIFSFPFFANDRISYLYAGILILLTFSYTDWYYSGIEEFKIITLRSILVKLISLALLFLFVKVQTDFKKYLFIIIFSLLGNQILSFFTILQKTKFNILKLSFRKHLHPLLYIFGATLAVSIYTVLDTLLLGFLSNDKAVGLYTASVKLIKITIPFVISLGVILMPSISHKFAQNSMKEVKQLLDKSYHFLVFFSIPIAAGLAILSPELIIIFSGNQFIKATTSMQILAFLPVLIGFGHFFCFQILIPAGKNKEIFFSMLIGVICSLTLNFILVPFLQEIGASIANVFTELIVTLSYFYFIKKIYSFKYNKQVIIQSIVSVLPFIPIVLIVRYFYINMIFTLSISFLLCAIVYFSIQLFIFKNNNIFYFVKTIQKQFRLKKQFDNE